MPFDDFATSAVPQDLETYEEYRRRSMAFVAARNVRIAAWARPDRYPADHFRHIANGFFTLSKALQRPEASRITG